MFQPHLQLHALSSHQSSFNSSFSQRSERSVAVDRREPTIAQLKETLCAEMSPNKRAVVEQLIKLWSQGDLDQNLTDKIKITGKWIVAALQLFFIKITYQWVHKSEPILVEKKLESK